jgi:hypothetical protein
MVAEGVFELIVTVCAEVYVPAPGLNVGLAAWVRLMVYTALATLLLV